jgi:hypothetical protein
VTLTASDPSTGCPPSSITATVNVNSNTGANFQAYNNNTTSRVVTTNVCLGSSLYFYNETPSPQYVVQSADNIRTQWDFNTNNGVVSMPGVIPNELRGPIEINVFSSTANITGLSYTPGQYGIGMINQDNNGCRDTIIKPNYIVVVFYANDNDYSSKSIFQKNLKKDLHMDYFSNNYLSQEIKNKIEYSQIYLKKIILEKNKNQETNFFKKLTNLLKFSKTRELIIFVYKKFFFNTIPFSSRLTIDKAIENCKIYNCKPIIVYIPNSKYWRPDVTADLFADSLKFYTIHNNINFIDMREDFYNFDENEFYAQSGPHLSPVGYKLVANKINQVIK